MTVYIFSILKSKFQHVLLKMILDPNRLYIRLWQLVRLGIAYANEIWWQ